MNVYNQYPSLPSLPQSGKLLVASKRTPIFLAAMAACITLGVWAAIVAEAATIKPWMIVMGLTIPAWVAFAVRVHIKTTASYQLYERKDGSVCFEIKQGKDILVMGKPIAYEFAHSEEPAVKQGTYVRLHLVLKAQKHVLVIFQDLAQGKIAPLHWPRVARPYGYPAQVTYYHTAYDHSLSLVTLEETLAQLRAVDAI